LYAINGDSIQIQDMTKSVSLLVLFSVCFLSVSSQSTTQAAKECRISSGIGLGGATNNSKSVGKDVWLQLDYRLSKNTSIAMEFENLSYKLHGYYPALPDDLDGINIVSNNFSFLFKYHIDTKLPLKFAVASGWTYTIKTREYYYYESSTAQDLSRYLSTADDYEVPLMLEARYPLWKAIDIQARVKCNLNTQKQSAFSSGIGLSLRL
jgi:hypothetical protein